MVKCDKCGKDATSYFDFNGKKLCIGCYADVSDKDDTPRKKVEQKDIPPNLELKTRPTHTGIYLRILGIISGIICILAGINMATIQSKATVAGEVGTIMEAYYNSMGVFVIGFGVFIIALSWGIAYLIDKK